MSPLQRAVTLEQMDDVALSIAKDLDLDMARLGDVLFNQAHRVAKAGLPFSLRALQSGPESRGLLDLPHALATATGAGAAQRRVENVIQNNMEPQVP